MALLRREGMGGVSLRKVAARVGITPMAVYRHFATKEALLEALLDDVLQRLEIPKVTRGPWRAQARALTLSFRRLLTANPNVVPLLTRGPALSLGALRLYDAAVRILRKGGMSDDDALRAYGAIYSYTLGFAVVELGRRGAGSAGRSRSVLPQAPLDELPTLRALAPRTGRFTEAQFLHGLDAMLDGLAAAVRRR